MAEPKKKCYGQEKKKMAIKLDKVGSGGVGAAILLLASAALASAVFGREKGWSSGENRRRRRQNAPPPAVNGLKNKNEEDEANKGLQLVLLDTSSSYVQKHPSGVTKLVSAQILAPAILLVLILFFILCDRTAQIEIKGGFETTHMTHEVKVSGSETSEQILYSVGPENLGNDDISDELIIHKDGFETTDMAHEVKSKLREEENRDFKLVSVEEWVRGDNALDEVHSDQMAYDEKLCKTVSEEICSNQEIICADTLSEALVSGSHNEDVNCDEKEVASPTEILEIIQEDEAFGGSHEDQIKHIDEQSVTEHKQCNLADKEIVPEKSARSHEDMVTTKDQAYEEVVESLELKENKPTTRFVVCQQKGHEDYVGEDMVPEVEESSGTIDTCTTIIRDDLVVGMRDDGNEGEENIDDCVDETEEVKLINQDLEGKISEDTTIKEGKQMTVAGCIMADNRQFTDGKGTLERTSIEDNSTNSTRWRELMCTLFVISSLLCSWFFGLSFLELSFIVFFIMVLSKIPTLIRTATRDCSCRWRFSEPIGKVGT